MERIFNSRRITLMVMFLLLILGSKCYAQVYNWNGEKEVTYNKQSTYADGWSEWSTTRPSNVSMYVKAAIYLPATDWSNQSCSLSSQQIITVGNFVRKEDGSYDQYNSKWETSYTACDGSYSGRHSSYSDGCGTCRLNTSDPTGWCVKSGAGYCGSQIDSKTCGTRNYTQKCYWIQCQENKTYYNSGCNSDFSESSSKGCGSRRQYCYKTTSSFLSFNDRNNWKASLSEAGGYAKKVYVYSYPKRVYIEYNGNNATGICGDGNTAAWENGTNGVNSNKQIKYELGNPVCKTDGKKSGSMASASNGNSGTYIDFSM